MLYEETHKIIISRNKMPFKFLSIAITLKLQSSKQQRKIFSLKLANSVKITIKWLVKVQ